MASLVALLLLLEFERHPRILLAAELSVLATMSVLAERATAAATRKATSLQAQPHNV